MRYIIDDLRKKEAQAELPVIRMKIDYELLTLYDAMQADDKVEMIKSKERLEKLRSQWLALKGK